MWLDRCIKSLTIGCILSSGALWAQAPQERPASPPSDEQIGREAFSLEDGKAINFQRGWRDVAVSESCRVLEQRANGKLDDPGGWQTARAIRLLSMLRPSGQNVADLLCKNLTFVPELTRGVHWTECYVSAMALIHIGGPQAANSVINYLKQPRGETELQLCAHILYRNDALEITFTRFRLATEQANRTMKPEEREVFARNLSQMKEWLSDPQFERNPTYRPR